MLKPPDYEYRELPAQPDSPGDCRGRTVSRYTGKSFTGCTGDSFSVCPCNSFLLFDLSLAEPNYLTLLRLDKFHYITTHSEMLILSYTNTIL